MKKSLSMAAMLLLAATAQAQLYKSVGPDGRVTYSDTPPAGKAVRVETRTAGGGSPDTAGLPFELAEAVRGNPVVFYSGDDCAPCIEGRRLLVQRGIPFTERTVTTPDDLAAYKRIGGGSQLPLLTVGRSRERGFDAASWNAALSAAGYPESSRLPRNWRPAPTQALAAPAPAAKPVRAPAEPEAVATDLPAPAGNAPPGFRF